MYMISDARHQLLKLVDFSFAGQFAEFNKKLNKNMMNWRGQILPTVQQKSTNFSKMMEKADILKVFRFCTVSYKVTTYVLCQCVLPVYLVVTKTNIDLPKLVCTYDLRIFLVIARQDPRPQSIFKSINFNLRLQF